MSMRIQYIKDGNRISGSMGTLAICICRPDDSPSVDAAGSMADAMEFYRKILTLKPDSVSALNGLGVCYARPGDEEKALNCFRAALRKDPLNAEVKKTWKK